MSRSREEQELTTRLAQGLVRREVMEPMSKIGWGHGTPPPPEAGQPATEGAPGKEAAPASAPTTGQPASPAASAPAPVVPPKADAPTDPASIIATYEALRDPETGLIMRKYKTVEDAIKGSGHLADMAKQSFTERDEARKKLAELQEENLKLRTQPAASPAAAPQRQPSASPSRAKVDEAQANLDGVLSRISENGGVLDAETSKSLSKAQRELADAAADWKVQESFSAQKEQEDSKNREWSAVDKYMKENHPTAENFAAEVALYMQSDPLLGRAVNALLAQGDKIGATELAWTTFKKVHGDQVTAAERASAEEAEADLAAREQVRKEQLERARRDAGAIQGSAGGAGVHERPVAGGSLEERQAAMEAMRREGDAPGSPAAKRFRELVIPLDPSIFGPQ